MLCRKFQAVLFNKTKRNHIVSRPVIATRSFSKWFDVLSGTNMTSAMRFRLFRDLVISRILYGWSRSYLVNSVVKRYRKERGVREVLHYFRQVFLKPRMAHLFVTVSAAYKKTEEATGPPKKCSKNIKDKDMEKLIGDLDNVEELSKATLFCVACSRRIVIDSQQPGVRYCVCSENKPLHGSHDGWVPYMEARDVVIWRKEYKPGGLYAYKVYGRYKHIKAKDFAMIQVDGAYRKVWDDAVASLSVVEKEANGIRDQLVLHWEVLWPRLFANRDYVYLRRHNEFTVQSNSFLNRDSIFETDVPSDTQVEIIEVPNVHSHAKKISLQNDLKERNTPHDSKENKVYVIVSRSCVHPNVLETKRAIRVLEYWSHMVVTTLNGPDEPGMEFVLTYYDEPTVGGLPTVISAWALGRAGPAFLERMRAAAADYRAWCALTGQQIPDFKEFGPEKVSFEGDESVGKFGEPLSELDMESSKQGPDLNGPDSKRENNSRTNTTEQSKKVTENTDGTEVKADKGVVNADKEVKADIVEVKTDTEVKADKEVKTDKEVKADKKVKIDKEVKSNKIGDGDAQDTPNDTSIQEQVEPEPKPVQNQSDIPKPLEIQPTDASNTIEQDSDILKNSTTDDGDADKDSNSADSELERDEEDEKQSRRWWHYLYPMYYFG